MYWLCLHFIMVCLDVVTFSIDIIICADCACEILTYSKIRGSIGTIRARTSVHNIIILRHRSVSQCSASSTHTRRCFLGLCRRLAKLRIGPNINRYRVSSEKSVTHLHDANGLPPVSRLV